MNNKQINKMLILEGTIYGAKGIIYGIIIGVTVIYVIYKIMVDTQIYLFSIPWFNMMMVILGTYIVIYTTIINCKKKINKKEIVEDVRNENI